MRNIPYQEKFVNYEKDTILGEVCLTMRNIPYQEKFVNYGKHTILGKGC